MKQNRIFHRALSLFLLVAILAGFAVPIRATKASSDLPLEMEQIENSSVTAELPPGAYGKHAKRSFHWCGKRGRGIG